MNSENFTRGARLIVSSSSACASKHAQAQTHIRSAAEGPRAAVADLLGETEICGDRQAKR